MSRSRPKVHQGINLLNALAERSLGRSAEEHDRSRWERARGNALKETSEKVKAYIESFMQRDWNAQGGKSSAGGEPPARRTGSLAESLVYEIGEEDIQSVTTTIQKKGRMRLSRKGRMYQKVKSMTVEEFQKVIINKNSSRIFVNPKADDRSKGKRLQYYSKYLQTGWVLGGRSGRRKRMDKGMRGDTPRRERKDKVGHPGRVQPPRPFLDLPIRYNQQAFFQHYYRGRLREYLPDHMKHLANEATLKFEYTRPFK